MENNRILIFGAGFLGSQCAQYFGEKAVLSQIDITDFMAVRDEVARIGPKVIINTAANTNTHQLEQFENKALAYRVNVQGPAQLALVAREFGACLVHISTAMMFDGDTITEDAQPSPCSYYALTKAWADAQLIPLMEDVTLIIRIHTPIAAFANPKNLLTKMLNWNQAVDASASVTVVEDLLYAMEQLITLQARGIYNVTNPGAMSFYEIAQLMQQHGLIPPEREIIRVSRDDFQKSVAESGGAYQPFPILSTKKLERAGIFMRPATEAVEASIKNYL